jgi:hypothetical protein
MPSANTPHQTGAPALCSVLHIGPAAVRCTTQVELGEWGQPHLGSLLRFGAAPRTRRQVAELLHLPSGAVARMERRVLRKLRRGALDPVRHGWNGWDEV